MGLEIYLIGLLVGTFTTLEAVPTITSFTPSSGCPSLAEVVVTGTNFGGVTTMTIGGTAVTSFTVDSDYPDYSYGRYRNGRCYICTESLRVMLRVQVHLRLLQVLLLYH